VKLTTLLVSVIDDEEGVRNVARMMLEWVGFTVLTGNRWPRRVGGVPEANR
jgi:FixJ family two-component response regulator